MSAWLCFSADGDEARLSCGALLSIGRDRANDVVLPDLQVSRQHALVRRLGQADYYLVDSGSANGSRLNGRRITTPTRLADGDRFRIGETEFHFAQAAQPASFTDSVSSLETVVMDAPLIQEITILVADLRGYTALTEALPIRTLTRLMSRWFERVSAVIEANGGRVDKFIGDCVFARWEYRDAPKGVFDALHTAAALRRVTTALSHDFPELPQALRMGVGINTGLASLDVGSDSTAMGDAVNVAFRLESATKALGVDMVLSESAYRHLPEQCWKGVEQALQLKGKRTPVRVIGIGFHVAERLSATLRAEAVESQKRDS